MKNKTLVITAASSVALLASGCGGEGEGFPSSDIELVIPYAPGGGADPIGREFSSLLSSKLGVNAIVNNLPGGGEAIGVSDVIGANPDGYTLGQASFSGLIIQPLLNDSLTYRGVDDYTPIARMSDTPDALFVPDDSPYESLQDFIDDARANPGEVTVAASGAMNISMFAMVGLQEEEDIELNLLATSGGAGEAATAALAGEVDAISVTAPGQLGMVEGGQLRALAHTGSSEYNDVLPGSTSFEEEGIEIPYVTTWILMAPSGLDEEALDTLEQIAVDVASSDEWIEWMADNGSVAAPEMTGDELIEWLKEQEEVYTDVIELAEQSDIEEE